VKAADLFSHTEFKEVLNVISDGLFFSDGTGKTLWVNDASEKILNTPKEQLIGKNVAELEAENIMNPSVTRLVLESRNTITTLQSSYGERKYIVTGHLLRLEEEDLVVVHSRDITNAVATSDKLEETERLIRNYSQEIKQMKDRPLPVKQKFIGGGKNFRDLNDLVEKAAGVNTTILITGETGVGKNAVAEQIHELSDRHNKPFVHINCGAIPESLFESELFGYKKGAFTGANTAGKAGLVKMAEGGTLFLDEISEIPIHLQPKLLQLLQNKTYLPVGETATQEADIRIIAATNKDLYEMMEKGSFREDLYYRLNIVPIYVPSLKERPEDIFPLLQSNLKYFNHLHGEMKYFSSQVIDILLNYEWSGNIRELENLVERLVVTSRASKITPEDLPEKIQSFSSEAATYILKEDESLNEAMERIEKSIISETYRKYKTTRKAADVLGMSQSGVMRRIKKYGIKPDQQ
jgi:TyrR family helix-turn-helix protein